MQTKNEPLLLSTSFTAKVGFIFVLTQENNFSMRVRFKTNRKRIGSSKRRFQKFYKIVLHFRDQHIFMCYNHRKLRMDVVNTLTFKQIFLKMKIFFKKLGYRFQTKILRSKTHHFHTKLPCQSEAKFIRNRMRSTKWTYHKERSFARDYFIFSKISFHFRTFYEDFI